MKVGGFYLQILLLSIIIDIFLPVPPPATAEGADLFLALSQSDLSECSEPISVQHLYGVLSLQMMPVPHICVFVRTIGVIKATFNMDLLFFLVMCCASVVSLAMSRRAYNVSQTPIRGKQWLGYWQLWANEHEDVKWWDDNTPGRTYIRRK